MICVSSKNTHEKTGKRRRKKLLYAIWKVHRTPKEIRETYRKRFGIETSYRQMNRRESRPAPAIHGCDFCSWALPSSCGTCGCGFIFASPKASTAPNRSCSSNCFASKKCSIGLSKSSNMPLEPTRLSGSISKPTNDLWQITHHRPNLGLLKLIESNLAAFASEDQESAKLFATLEFARDGLPYDLHPLLIPLALHERFVDAAYLEAWHGGPIPPPGASRSIG